MMKYQQIIIENYNDPQGLENLYQTARQENKVAEFATDLLACYQQAADNILYTAWYYRLQQQQVEEPSDSQSVNWKLAVPLSIAIGLVFWLLSLPKLALKFSDGAPYLAQIWALIGGGFAIGYLTLTAKTHGKRAVAVIVGLLMAGAYSMTFSILPNDRNYEGLMIAHLPLLAWIGVVVSLLGGKADSQNRFAFLIKSIETFVMGGIYLIGGVVFALITFGLFETIKVNIPDEISSLIFLGGAGAIILLATASTYNPLVEAAAQNFRHGLSKHISTLMRLLMPLTLLVLVIFSYFILQPANFWRPFNDRDALIIYNVMLFAVMLLLVGAIPVHAHDLSPKVQAALYKGVLATAILTVLVSLYAMSATLYRTYLGVITMNRMAVIGWNSINIAILIGLIYRLTINYASFIPDRLKWLKVNHTWIESAQTTFSQGIVAYIGWTIFVILAVPFIFGEGLTTGWVKPTMPTNQPIVGATSIKPTTTPRPMPTPTPRRSLTKLPLGCPPSCSKVNLSGADLSEVNLREADLSGSNLSQADLSQADLQGANLRGADLRGTNLTETNLNESQLHAAKIDPTTKLDEKWRMVWQIVNHGAAKRDLNGLYLSKANLSGADLREADLTFGSLTGANLRGADLRGANLNHTSLLESKIDESTKLDDKGRMIWEIVNQGASRRDLSGVNLSQADLSQADLSYANLSRAVLTDTNLSGTNLYGADLRGAILTEPNSQGERPHEADLQQANLIAVQMDKTTQIEERWRLVWEIVNHGGANRNLSGVDLSQADLHGVDFSGATLVGAMLTGANLRKANLSDADLNGAIFGGTDLTGANLRGANFYEARLSETILPTDLRGANFRKATMYNVNLAGYDFSGLNLSRADLSRANLAEANLAQADLSETHLERAYLWKANLRGANLRGVYLDNAYLREANLDGADLTGAQFNQTVMPDGKIVSQ